METTIDFKGILTHNKVINYILAGNAYVTFRNKETQNRYTFHIEKSDTNENLHFVNVLFGSDNTNDYVYIGCIINGNLFKLTKNSKVKDTDVRFKTFNYIFNHLLNNNLSNLVEIWHEGCCGRCGRKLTVPESIESGFGSTCLSLMNRTN